MRCNLAQRQHSLERGGPIDLDLPTGDLHRVQVVGSKRVTRRDVSFTYSCKHPFFLLPCTWWPSRRFGVGFACGGTPMRL